MTAKSTNITRPTHVTVGHKDFSIHWLDEEEWADLRTDGDATDHRGFTDHLEGAIYIRTFIGRLDGRPCSIDSLKETLVHEVLHTVTHQSGVAWHLVEVFKSDTEADIDEYIVNNMAPTMTHVLCNNHRLFDWLVNAK